VRREEQDENDAYLADWRVLWNAAPEAVHEQISNRRKAEPVKIGTVDEESWRLLWDAAPEDLKAELRIRWHDQQHLPFEGNRPLTAAQLREIIDTQKKSLRRWRPFEWVLTIIGIWLIVAIASSVWHSKLRYAMSYGAHWSGVTVEKKPHDCDFLAAPLGEKNCNSDAQVQTQKTTLSLDKNSGRRIVSYDDGKTWEFNDGPNPAKEGTTVYVRWQKVDD
jgi:hypothetical protein